MAETMDVKILSFPLANTAGDWQGDDVTGHMFRVPSAIHGGGMTILAAYGVNAAATGAGTGFGFQLENWGTAGTAIKSSGGTVATSVGGTAAPWAANVPQAMELVNPFIATDEWLVARKSETNSSDPTRGVIVLHVLQGK